MKKKILFVCKYNRFRSRIAEAYFNKINKNKNIIAKSAGIIRGNSLDSKLINLAKKFGLNIRGKPKNLSIDLLKWQNMIVVVADNVPASLFKKRWARGKKLIIWKIPDREESVKPIIKKVNKLLRQFGEEV